LVITDGSDPWLVNASPDLRQQMGAWSGLQPAAAPWRNSPLRGVFLTNADLDHVLGLYLLREGPLLEVYAPDAVRRAAEEHLGLGNVLNRFCGISWKESSSQFTPVLGADRRSSGIQVRSIPLPASPPLFATSLGMVGTHSVAYEFLDPKTGGRLLVAPDVAEVTPELHEALASSQAVVFDGTFWSAEELAEVRPGARTAAQMGHVTVRDVSLELLRKSAAHFKIYTHINNTNPILSPGSAERAAVEAAGLIVGYDGFEFEL
jgi:pyrroloquinoline quinone biosynthesis protein B